MRHYFLAGFAFLFAMWIPPIHAQNFGDDVIFEPIYVNEGVMINYQERFIRYTTRTSQRDYAFPDDAGRVENAMIEDPTSGYITLRMSD